MPISDDEIYALQRITENKLDVTPLPYFNGGDRVTISRGPLAGITGIAVDEIAPSAYRIWNTHYEICNG